MQQRHSGNTSKLSISFLLYSDCSKLPLDRFIDCLVDNDLSQLIISGTPTPEQLQETWDKIYLEYCQLSQNGTYNETLELYREIYDLRAKISIVNNTIQYLQISYDRELVLILNKLALGCTVTEEDKGEVLIDKLNGVIARMKKWFPKLKQREKELEELRKENTGKVDRSYFDNWLDAISIDFGFMIESSRITVSRFCRAIAKLNKQDNAAQIKSIKQSRSIA